MKTDHSYASAHRHSPWRTGTHVPIESTLERPLAEHIARGFVAMTVDRFFDGGSCAAIFWHADGSGLEISARQPHDVARVATDGGVLCVAAALVPRPPDARPLPDDFRRSLHATTLVRLERGRTVACGLALTGRAGSRVVLLTGPWPYALEIDADFATCDGPCEGPRRTDAARR